MVIGHIDLTKN